MASAMNRVRNLIHVNKIHEQGCLGEGVGVAILDTGLAVHPDFEGRIVCFRDFVQYRASLYDDSSHGTHVTGILGGSGKASRGKFKGIAPRCNLIILKVLDSYGNGRKEEVIKAIQWIEANRKRYNIKVINISVGTVNESTVRDQMLVDAVEHMWDLGITVVVAAGNMGPEPGTVTVPGNSKKVITVGVAEQNKEFPYSGIGPTRECVCKPDLTAPGFEINSCSSNPKQGFYQIKSGTSMATPVVSGAIALGLSKYPYLTNVELKMALRRSSVDLGMDRNRQGWGCIDIERLFRELGS